MGFHQRVPSGLFSTNQIVNGGSSRREATPAAKPKACPWCGGRTVEGATNCFHCERALPVKVEDEEESPVGRAVGALMGGLVIVGLFTAIWLAIDLYVVSLF